VNVSGGYSPAAARRALPRRNKAQRLRPTSQPRRNKALHLRPTNQPRQTRIVMITGSEGTSANVDHARKVAK
jgi:hypothetical protein